MTPPNRPYNLIVSTSSETNRPSEAYKIIFSKISEYFQNCGDEPKWIRGVGDHLNKLVLVNNVVENVDNSATEQEGTPLVTESYKKRIKITFSQARSLSLNALYDADERRRKFAEEEAKIVSVWED
jgi:hypothetical protein